MKIDRARIVDEALLLLNEVGLDGLTTRALADRLGIRQPALYWHFKGKQALLSAMNAEILKRGHVVRVPRPEEGWREFLTDNCRSFRRALLAFRDGGRVHAGTEAEPDDLAVVERQLDALARAGLAAEEAMELLVALGRYTLGCVIEEQSDPAAGPAHLVEAAAPHPLTRRALRHYREGGAEAFFEAGLGLILDGVASRIRVVAPRN